MNLIKTVDRRKVLEWATGIAVASALPSSLPAESAHASEDWSRRLVESTLKRNPDPAAFNHGWDYPAGLFLFGQYLVYKRTRDPHLLAYIAGYVDAHVDASGHLDIPIESLDNVLAANLLILLYKETKQPRYKLGAEIFRRRFDTYPRTTDGGFWHGNRPERAWQLWLDGNYMALQLGTHTNSTAFEPIPRSCTIWPQFPSTTAAFR